MAYVDGKYDAETEALIKKYPADACLVIVVGSPEVSGFSISAKTPGVLVFVPDMLRHLADDVEKSVCKQEWKKVKVSQEE